MVSELGIRLRSDRPVLGNWLSIPAPSIGELFASMGFDFVTIDMEHSASGIQGILEAVRGIDAASGNAKSIVRLPGHDPDRIKRVLDIGVDGIMVPMVETEVEAAAIVDACRYPPAGSRGVGPGRGATYGMELDSTVAADDAAIAIIAQIESPTAVDNAGAIAAVDGIDALFVGPTDLSVAMGIFGEDEDRLFERMDVVLASAADVGTPVGTIAIGDEQIERCARAGFDFLAVGYDVHYLVGGSERALATYDAATDR